MSIQVSKEQIITQDAEKLKHGDKQAAGDKPAEILTDRQSKWSIVKRTDQLTKWLTESHKSGFKSSKEGKWWNERKEERNEAERRCVPTAKRSEGHNKKTQTRFLTEQTKQNQEYKK